MCFRQFSKYWQKYHLWTKPTSFGFLGASLTYLEKIKGLGDVVKWIWVQIVSYCVYCAVIKVFCSSSSELWAHLQLLLVYQLLSGNYSNKDILLYFIALINIHRICLHVRWSESCLYDKIYPINYFDPLSQSLRKNGWETGKLSAISSLFGSQWWLLR